MPPHHSTVLTFPNPNVISRCKAVKQFGQNVGRETQRHFGQGQSGAKQFTEKHSTMAES